MQSLGNRVTIIKKRDIEVSSIQAHAVEAGLNLKQLLVEVFHDIQNSKG